MPIVLKLENEDRLSLAEFVDHLETTFDLDEADSLIGVAPYLRALANDPDLIAHHCNAEIQRVLDAKEESPFVSSPLELASAPSYALQATIWMPDSVAEALRPPSAQTQTDRRAHNHNFNVMTIGYFGPGCITDLYTFNAKDDRAEPADRVDLRFNQRVRIQKDCAVICREAVDVHAHVTPEALSISMSLCIFSDRTPVTDRLIFDPQESTICGHVESAGIYRRASVVRLAGEVGNDQTLELFDALLRRSPCRRVRGAALDAAARLPEIDDEERIRVIKRAVKDSDDALRQRAKSLIEKLSDSV